MLSGLPFKLAIKQVAEHNRPTCINCGNKIKGGTSGRHFLCSRVPCRQVYRRYKMYWYEQGIPKDEAIELALHIEEQKRHALKVIEKLKEVRKVA